MQPYHPERQPRMLKLKDYPPAGDFYRILPQHYKVRVRPRGPLTHMQHPHHHHTLVHMPRPRPQTAAVRLELDRCCVVWWQSQL